MLCEVKDIFEIDIKGTDPKQVHVKGRLKGHIEF